MQHATRDGTVSHGAGAWLRAWPGRSRLARYGLSLGTAILALGAARDASAQPVDEVRKFPNVLILMDNSGSMERMIDGSFPELNIGVVSGGINNACLPGTQSNPNRWGVALQALTGNIAPYFSCLAQPRSTAKTMAQGLPANMAMSFVDEYSINNVTPYDTGYFLPYHRPLSGSCTMAPGVLPGAPTNQGVGPLRTGEAAPGSASAWLSNGVVSKNYTAAAIAAPSNAAYACSFAQNTDGALDSVVDLVRLGFMTFDTDVSAATGVTTSTTPAVLTGAPFAGMWSYFVGWDGSQSAAPASGSPATPSCPLAPFEVGARNPAAPPWEGRFIKFPASDAIADIEATNSNVQNVINALRPYGATPVAGLMKDAKDYFWTDSTGPGQTDNFVKGGCRDQYIILLSDGAPNLDLQPGCASGGTCPYPLPETTAASMFTAVPTSGQHVTTYVIGFAVSSYGDQGVPSQCSTLVQNGSLTSQCSTANPSAQLQACCTLQKMALFGGSNHAYFADTPGALNQAFSDIFGDILKNVSTRTAPSYSPVVTSGAYDTVNAQSTAPSSSSFLSIFKPAVGRPWSGDVQRQRSVCTPSGSTFTVPAPVVDFSKGDDFAANVNTTVNLGQRKFFAVKPGASDQTTGIDATQTLRPFVAPGPPADPGVPADGIGLDPGGTGNAYGAVQLGPTVSNIRAGLVPAAGANALAVTSAQAQCKSTTGNYLTAAQCASLALNYVFAQPTSVPLQPPSANPVPDSSGFMPFVSRYCTQNCGTDHPTESAIGDVFHATPAVVGPPASFLRDESYEQFRNNNSANYHNVSGAARPTVVYVATNDGLLHAFDANVTAEVNNELWAFLPPAVMPQLISQYPASHLQLLDGTPIVKDVVFKRARTAGAPVTVDPTIWHTMLVAGFGPQSRGYYALDVTDPDGTNIPTSGPSFQWQLTKMGSAAGIQLPEIFGQHSGTPAITTVFADLSGAHAPTLSPSEYGVAILPGGLEVGSTSATVSCARATKLTDSAPVGTPSYAARAKVRCWGGPVSPSVVPLSADPVVGRSVAVINIKTGEIIRVFMRKADLATTNPLLVKNRVIDTPLDSPMTGVPVVYPNDTGTVAQKFFMADADGTLWKFDLTNPDPDFWTGELFYDMFNATAYPSTTAFAGQVVQVSPVLSLDRFGNVVIIASSGDQESYATSGTNFTVSLTERVQGATTPKLRAAVNWWQQHDNGERVAGPMVVFDSVFYMATFLPSSASASCSVGNPVIWGMDFQKENDSTLATGGLPKLDPTLSGTLVKSTSPAAAAGHVIPGVSINQTPACASAGAGAFDGYVAGSSHSSISNSTAATYSLFATYGGKPASGTNAVNTFTQQLRSPKTMTVVDSWAGVVE